MAKMRIHLSGEENLARPEVVLGDESCLMMTFAEIRPKKKGRPAPRFLKVYRVRKLQQQKKGKKQP